MPHAPCHPLPPITPRSRQVGVVIAATWEENYGGASASLRPSLSTPQCPYTLASYTLASYALASYALASHTSYALASYTSYVNQSHK